MMNSNESVNLLFMIPVLLNKTSTHRIGLDQVVFNYHKIDFYKFILKCWRAEQNANSNKCSHNIRFCLSNKW